MNPILKVAAIGVGVAAAAVGAKEVVSRLTYKEIQSRQTDALLVQRQAELLGMTEDDLASLSVPLPEDLGKEAFQLGFIEPLKAAMNGSCDDRISALVGLMGAVAKMEQLGGDIEDFYGAGDKELIEGYEAALQEECTKEAYADCVKNHDFSRLLLLGPTRTRGDALLGRSVSYEGYDALLEKCLSFKLEYEDRIEVPPLEMQFEVRSLVPLIRENTGDRSSFTLSGEAPVTPKVNGHPPYRSEVPCKETVVGPTPREPVRVVRLELWPDTSGEGALRQEAERIRSARHALMEEEKSGKAATPGDSSRRTQLRKGLDRDEAARRAASGKKAGKGMNKPRRIELSLLPGSFDAHMMLDCPPLTRAPHVEMGGFYNAWPVLFGDYFKEGNALFVFEPHEIHGGELFARKSVRGQGPQGVTGSMTLTLWHRPPATATASMD